MQIQKTGYISAILFLISSSSIHYLLEELGFAKITTIAIQSMLFGFGLGWLFCFLALKKYLPK